MFNFVKSKLVLIEGRSLIRMVWFILTLVQQRVKGFMFIGHRPLQQVDNCVVVNTRYDTPAAAAAAAAAEHHRERS